jgi:hypothetical protein
VRKVPPVSTRRAAEQYERELRNVLLAGTPARKEESRETEPARAPTVREFKDDFLETYVEVNNKPSEIAQKKLVFRYHIDPALGGVSLDAIAARIEPSRRNCCARA